MRKGGFTRISAGLLLFAAISVAGCGIQAEYKRTVRLSAPLAPGSTFAAQTHNGYIRTNGADVTDCNMTATITARAETEEEARELAEKVEIDLESSGETITARINRPTGLINKSVAVSLDVTVPGRTSLQLETHNGSVTVTDITGDVHATTHNGKITAMRISGSTVLESHNGLISVGQTAGDAKLRTHNGSVKASYCESASPVSDISIVTANGSIELATPPDYSAQIEASTHNGSISTDLPITLVGQLTRNRLSGTVGSGRGKLYLETHNGSIRIR